PQHRQEYRDRSRNAAKSNPLLYADPFDALAPEAVRLRRLREASPGIQLGRARSTPGQRRLLGLSERLREASRAARARNCRMASDRASGWALARRHLGSRRRG